MRPTLLALVVLLGGCCPLWPSTDEETVTPAPSTTADPVAAPVPTAPAAGCDISQMILGTWTAEGLTEEYRAGDVYVLNGAEGTVRWLGPGRAFLDVGALHAEYYLMLVNVNELIAINPDHVGFHYTRSSSPPAVDASCFDHSQSLVGTWIGGTYAETYEAGGAYQVNNNSGTWQLRTPGNLRIDTQTGIGDYYIAVLSPTTMVAVSQQTQAATIYTRQ